jgi:hypothetical protein
MRGWYTCLAVFALGLQFGGCLNVKELSSCERTDNPLPVKTIFEMFDEIDETHNLSPTRASEILGIELKAVPQESNKELYIFRGYGGMWREAELRLPPKGDGSSFVLVLRPDLPVAILDVVAHFGKDFKLESPNPSAGDKATYGYSYARKDGRIRFSFRSFQDPNVTTILFDRMANP